MDISLMSRTERQGKVLHDMSLSVSPYIDIQLMHN